MSILAKAALPILLASGVMVAHGSINAGRTAQASTATQEMSPASRLAISQEAIIHLHTITAALTTNQPLSAQVSPADLETAARSVTQYNAQAPSVCTDGEVALLSVDMTPMEVRQGIVQFIQACRSVL